MQVTEILGKIIRLYDYVFVTDGRDRCFGCVTGFSTMLVGNTPSAAMSVEPHDGGIEVFVISDVTLIRRFGSLTEMKADPDFQKIIEKSKRA